MREEPEIIERLEAESINLGSCCIYYECVGDFYRGWVAALQWVLDKSDVQWAKDAKEPVIEADAEKVATESVSQPEIVFCQYCGTALG